jgi:hypothetical protein
VGKNIAGKVLSSSPATVSLGNSTWACFQGSWFSYILSDNVGL